MRDKRGSVVQPCTNKQDLIPLVNSFTIRSREDTPSAGVRRGRAGPGEAGRAGKQGWGLMLDVREEMPICVRIWKSV